MADKKAWDVLVIGGGLAGLAAAATAARAGCGVAVLDAHLPGGRARTDERDGFCFNQGPRALFNGGPAAEVLRRLGVRPTGAPPATASGTVWRDGSLYRLPAGPLSLARTDLLGARSKAQVARVLGGLGRLRAEGLAGMTAATWLSSYGMRDDALGFVTALTRVATYVDDLEQLSADAATRQLQLAVGKGVTYLDGGWQTLVTQLQHVASAAGSTIVASRPVVALEGGEAGGTGWVAHTDQGDLHAATVVIATGGPAAARAILPHHPGWECGPEARAACLDLGLRRPPDPRVVFGVDAPLYLSTHCPPANLARRGGAVVHVMRYGARSAAQDRPELEALAGLVGIGEADIVTRRFLHSMVVTHGLPQAGDGLPGRPGVDVPGLAGAFVAGDWVGPVGLLADASLASAEAAAHAAIAYARTGRATGGLAAA